MKLYGNPLHRDFDLDQEKSPDEYKRQFDLFQEQNYEKWLNETDRGFDVQTKNYKEKEWERMWKKQQDKSIKKINWYEEKRTKMVKEDTIKKDFNDYKEGNYLTWLNVTDRGKQQKIKNYEKRQEMLKNKREKENRKIHEENRKLKLRKTYDIEKIKDEVRKDIMRKLEDEDEDDDDDESEEEEFSD